MLNSIIKQENNLTLVSYNKLLDTNAALNIVGLCYNTFYSLLRKNFIPHIRDGKKLFFRKEDIISFMKLFKAGDWSNVKDETLLLFDKKSDVKSLASFLGINYNTLLVRLKNTDFPHFQFGKKIIIPQNYYLESNKLTVTTKWDKYNNDSRK